MYPGIHAQANPDKVAALMVDDGSSITYGQLNVRSAALASAMYDLGLRKGDGVAVLTDNTLEIYEIYWAAMQSGLYITPVNCNLTAGEAAYIIDDCDAKILFVSAALSTLSVEVSQQIAVEYAFAFGGEIDGYRSYHSLISGGGAQLATQPRGAEMMYSSGTTGRPKGIRSAMLPIQVHEPGDAVTGLLSGAFNVGPNDVYLQPAPIYHAAPLKWSTSVQALGGTVVMMGKYDPLAALQAIQVHEVTVAQFVPTMFVRMLQLPEEQRAVCDHSTLRLAVHAAAPCPPEVKRAMIDWWGPILFEYYGSTEQHGATFIATADWLERPGSVGRAAVGEIHICDDEGAELATGEVGSVYFALENVPFAYHKDDAKTQAARHPKFRTWTTVGDLGYVDKDGFLYLTDRKSFVIISGGVNIYPQEIENVLALHDRIYDVAVIGVPDHEMGQAVKAVVQLKQGVESTPQLKQDIIDYVRARIAHFKAPRSVDFVADLPRTPTGKLVKRELERLYAANVQS